MNKKLLDATEISTSGTELCKMEKNWIKPGMDVVIQEEALLSTLLSDNVIIMYMHCCFRSSGPIYTYPLYECE